MINRRRLTFQLTPLLDLLLIVIFAQYMEVRATTRTQAEELRAAVERAEGLPTVEEMQEQVARLEKSNAELTRERDAAEQRLDRLSEQFAEVFRLNEDAIEKLLDADDPKLAGLTEEQLEKLRERLGELVKAKGAEAVEHLVTYEELRKRADVWRIRVGTVEEKGRVQLTAGGREESFAVKSAEDFSDRVFAVYKGLPQPKSHVVILLTYDSKRAELVTLNDVRSGLPRLVNRMQADGDSRFFWAEIGYDPRVLGLPN